MSEVVADGVEARLDRLESEGARNYDPAACDCVRAMLTRAESLGGAVANILVQRAEAHVTRLRERLERDRARVLANVAAVEVKHGEQDELRRAVERGEITRAARTSRRLSVRPAPAKRPVRVETPETRDVAEPPRQTRKKRAMAYEDSVAELVASLALARAVDVVPEDAGPYNALRIASEALDRMRELSPFYLTVQLNRLEELATLLSLPELPSKVPEKVLPPRKKRKG